MILRGEVALHNRLTQRRYDVAPMDLPFDRVWLPFIYLYGVGGIFFLTGLFLVLKSGALDLKRRTHRRWLGVLIFGFFWYFAIHGLGTLAAINL